MVFMAVTAHENEQPGMPNQTQHTTIPLKAQAAHCTTPNAP